MAQRNINELIQSLQPGAKVKLIEVDCTPFNGEILRFHNYNVPHTEEELLAYAQAGQDVPAKSIMFQGKEYGAWPYRLSGIEWDGTGSSPTPKLEVSNIDGHITSLCLQFQNLFGAVVTEHTTFEQYLDGASDADPEMEFTQTWYVCRKSNGDYPTIEFELCSPADLTGRQLPGRQIHGLCHWALTGKYRGADCGYTGQVFFTDKGVPTDDPLKDACGGLCSDCKLRFGEESPLPFGGFIASSLIS